MDIAKLKDMSKLLAHSHINNIFQDIMLSSKILTLTRPYGITCLLYKNSIQEMQYNYAFIKEQLILLYVCLITYFIYNKNYNAISSNVQCEQKKNLILSHNCNILMFLLLLGLIVFLVLNRRGIKSFYNALFTKNGGPCSKIRCKLPLLFFLISQ